MDSESLPDQIARTMDSVTERKQMYDQGRKFMPINELERLIRANRKEVEKLCGIDHENPDSLNDIIRILAILASRDLLKEKTYQTVRRIGISDCHLPLVYDKSRSSFMSDIRVADAGQPRDIQEFESFLSGLANCIEFTELQYRFCIPTFGNAEFTQLHSNSILPIYHLGKKTEVGSFGMVDQVQVHHAHLKLDRPVTKENNPKLALKQLLSDSEAEFDREREALSKIQKLCHDHLITLIASFKRGREFFFLFPWAEGGNLRQLWNKNWSPTREQTEWALGQMLGLAEAIQHLHLPTNNLDLTENGRHGDLRPENILAFHDKKAHGSVAVLKLRIADVGLAKFHQKITSERTAGTTTTGGSMEYAPPESLLEGEEVKRSRKYDMWSLGCIFLEFIVWVVEGPEGLAEFREERAKKKTSNQTYSEYEPYYRGRWNNKGYEVHPKVRVRLSSIRKSPKSSKELRALADIIEMGLLVVDEEKRFSAKQLMDMLKRAGLGTMENEEDNVRSELHKMEEPEKGKKVSRWRLRCLQIISSPSSSRNY
ncbi:kinase-like domain-containing protein [Podospora fimiseda]|uniref:Kinase-like domain-containing protein n=1 Tax=Podospora fimiseda TaxID=252190 RepID=A0AAN7H341_9PEZI|nr:kinase-like domain-containing protein [Podospora fimiseda]